jgi:hypothetical protein
VLWTNLWIVPAKVDGAWRMQVDGHGDYDLALAEGGNHIRVGSLLFGARSSQ